MTLEISNPQFPRSCRYNPEWIRSAAGGGANSLWLAEWLSHSLELREGMRILDLGCGKSASSIFLAKEFGVKVWAVDLWTNPSDSVCRIRDAGVELSVFPLQADARALPFGRDFFDAIVSIDSYPYYGSDFFYLKYLARLVKPGGQIAIAGAGMINEIDSPVPEHLREWWAVEPDMWCLHSADWWKDLWIKNGVVDIEIADCMPEGWKLWLQWHHFLCPENKLEIDSIAADQGRHLGYVRVVARRRIGVEINDPITSVPGGYSSHPLMRSNLS